MSDNATQGVRGSNGYPANQRPTNYGKEIKQMPTGARFTREDTMRTIAAKRKGQRPIKFREGGLHASTGTPAGKKISASQHARAASGTLGPKAAKQENFYRNVLHGRGK